MSEGVDIPRLRVLCYLTNARSELIFRQLVGRIVRVRDGDVRPGYLLYPTDPTLDDLVRQLQTEVHESADGGAARARPPAADEDNAEEEIAKEIEVIEATFRPLDPFAAIAATVNPDDLFTMPEEPRGGGLDIGQAVGAILDRAQQRQRLTGLTRDVAQRYGLEMHDVYSHFARLRGPVDQADPVEMARRSATMEKWLEQGHHPVRKRATSRR